MIISVLLLCAGLALLLKGADWLVEGSSRLARRIGVSELLIGLTIVAFGTSMPEMIVNLVASAQGRADIAFGNIIGSNISNLLLILGAAGLVAALSMARDVVLFELPLSIGAALMMIIFVRDGVLSRVEGVALAALFAFFVYRSIRDSQRRRTTHKNMNSAQHGVAWRVLLGLAALVIGGKLTVDGAVTVARSLGISEALIALTIISVGTSLPELATSVVAAFRKKPDLAIGNVIGSNIFNILCILALSAIVRPLTFNPALLIDSLILIGASLLVLATMLIGKKHTLERWQAGVLVGAYAAYVTFLVWRG